MGIIDLVGRGLGCDGSGIVSFPLAVSFHVATLLES